MRPKKRILLIDSDEIRQSILRFVLRVHCYYVESERSENTARKNVAGPIDFIIARWPVNEERLARLAEIKDCRYLILAEEMEKPPDGTGAESFLLGVQCSHANIVNAAKFGVARKRGPKKRSMPGVIRTLGDQAYLQQFEQDLGWLAEMAESFRKGSLNRARCERLLRHLDDSFHQAHRLFRIKFRRAA